MTNEPRSMRLFVAIDPPSSWKDALAALQDEMRQALAADEIARNLRVRWSRPEGIHLTLKFLGNVATDRLETIRHALESAVPEAPGFSLHVAGVGTFSDGRAPRVVLATLGGDTKELHKLHERIETWLAGARIPRERRSFHPHLTLGRLPEGATRAQRERLVQLTSLPLPSSLRAFEVSEIVLMESFLGPGGSRYERLLTVPSAPLQTPDQHL